LSRFRLRVTSAALLALALLAAACSTPGETAQPDSTSPGETPLDAAEANGDDGSGDETSTPSTSTTAANGAADDGSANGDAETDGTAVGCVGVSQGVSALTVEVGESTYDVRVYVPTGYAPDGAVTPAVLNWHGLGSDGFQQATYSGYETLAETEGFLVVHPTGQPAPGTDQNAWDFGGLTPEQLSTLGVETEGRGDDVAMADQLIDQLLADWCVDPDRVYSTGLSNGGFFTTRLICDLSERIAAAVVVAGMTHPDDCQPEEAVPLLVYHGTDDQIVPYEGGAGELLPDNAPDELVALFNQTIAEEFGQFATTLGCDDAPTVTDQSNDVTAYRYDGCDGGRFEVTLFEVAGGGHTWPGSALGLFLEDALGYTTFDVDATADGWAYMSRFTR